MKDRSGNILGLDLSATRTGIAVVDEKGNPLYTNCAGNSLKKGQDKNMTFVINRWFGIVTEINKTIREFDIKHIFIEDYAFGKKFQRETLAEIHAVVISQIYLNFKMIPRKIGISAWRKGLFLKSGTHNKKKVCEYINSIFRVEREIKTDKNKTALSDEREAMGIAIAGYRCLHESVQLALLE